MHLVRRLRVVLPRLVGPPNQLCLSVEKDRCLVHATGGLHRNLRWLGGRAFVQRGGPSEVDVLLGLRGGLHPCRFHRDLGRTGDFTGFSRRLRLCGRLL